MREDWYYIYGVLFGCPMIERVKDCPHYSNEHLSINDKLKWFDTLSNDEKQKIVYHHEKCMHKRSLKG